MSELKREALESLKARKFDLSKLMHRFFDSNGTFS